MPATRPSLMVHLGSQQVRVVPDFLADASSRKDVRVGAAVHLPQFQPTTARARIAAFAEDAAYVLADPESHRVQWKPEYRGKYRGKLKYLGFKKPESKVVEFVDAVLKEQAGHEVDALISPWLIHGAVAGRENLDAMRSFAEEADRHPLVKDRPLLIGLGIRDVLVIDDRERDLFSAEVIDWPKRPVYLRVHVAGSPSYRQFRERDLLFGLKQLVRDLAKNERPIVLPQAGLVGWLMLAFGAVTTGTGVLSSLQRFAPNPGEGGGGGNPPLKWYFLPQFLGYVQRDEITLLEDVEDFEACPCPYCERLDFERGGAWDQATAGMHYLWWCSKLVSEAGNRATARAAIRSRIALAASFWQKAQEAEVGLDERSEPKHLAAWSEVVAAP